MIDPMVVGGFLFGAGTVFGAVLSRLPRRSSRRSSQPRPICSCDHGPGMHHITTGACNYVRQQLVHIDDVGRKHYMNVSCTCLHYDGPEQFSQLVPRPTYLPPTGD